VLQLNKKSGGGGVVQRTRYLEKIIPFIDQPLIKVIIGVRRSGKTVLLAQIREYIESKIAPATQIVNLNFESYANRTLLDGAALYDFVLQKSKEAGKRIYLFLDEIQEVEGWQKVINSLTVDIDCDIYLTGSNSNMLSGELATYIAGRYVHFTVYPFTFSESLEMFQATGNTAPKEELFDNYLKYGGLPQRFLLRDELSIRTYMDDVYNTIVIKDVIARNKITDIDLLKRLTAFLLDNAGNTFSANSICNKLKAEGLNTTVATLMNYIAAIKNAMIVNVSPRYDLKGRALLSTNEKYYATDLGLRNNVKSSDITDYNKLYENVVYLELLSRGYEITVGKIGEYEIDFICIRGDKKMYVQVAYLLADRAVTEREFRPLLKIDDNFPKYVISGDRHDFSGNGIIHKNIIDFLLNETV
jgi:hypothetical protein